MGYVEETGIAQYFRDARIAPIYAGTNGIQALDLVFRKMPFDKGKVVEKLFVDFRTTAEKLSEIKDLEYLGDILNIHTDKLNKVTKKVNLDLLNGDVQNVSASATPYTKMFGQVLGGYYMAKAAILANKMQEVTNEEYYLNKVTISKFYISQLLPLASGYISSSIADSKELFSIKSENI
jgi:hypothetical protein